MSGPTPRKRLKEIWRVDKRKAKEARRVEAKKWKGKARSRTSDKELDNAEHHRGSSLCQSSGTILVTIDRRGYLRRSE